MNTKYDQAYDCFYDAFNEIENKGYLPHSQVNVLREVISDALNDFEADEDKGNEALDLANEMGEEGV